MAVHAMRVRAGQTKMNKQANKQGWEVSHGRESQLETKGRLCLAWFDQNGSDGTLLHCGGMMICHAEHIHELKLSSGANQGTATQTSSLVMTPDGLCTYMQTMLRVHP